MKPKQLVEAISRPDFSYRKKLKNQITFYNSIINKMSILCIALLLSIGTSAQTGSSDPVCSAEPPSSIIDGIEEASSYDLVYALTVPESRGGFSGNVEYLVDNSDIDVDCFNRVAYLVLKQGRWIWVSMDAFTDDLDALAFPEKDVEGREFILQQTVNNLNVIVRCEFYGSEYRYYSRREYRDLALWLRSRKDRSRPNAVECNMIGEINMIANVLEVSRFMIMRTRKSYLPLTAGKIMRVISQV